MRIVHRLRVAWIVGLVLLLYFAVPVNTEARGGIVLRVGAAALVLTVLALMVLGQVRLSLASPDRRIDGLVAAIVAVWTVFALAFYILALHRPDQVEGLRTRVDSLYFTATTMLTVGYGDIHAAGQLARVLVLVEMAFNVVFVAAAASLLSGRVRRVAAASHGSGEVGAARPHEADGDHPRPTSGSDHEQ